MLQPRRQADLAQEPVGAEAGRELGVEQLERDRPVVFEVLRQEYRRHPAAPELPLERIARAKAFQELGAQVGHGRPMSGEVGSRFNRATPGQLTTSNGFPLERAHVTGAPSDRPHHATFSEALQRPAGASAAAGAGHPDPRVVAVTPRPE